MRILLMALAFSVTVPLPVSAQTFQADDRFSSSDRRILIGLAIPFGGGGSQTERQPRLDLAFDHRRLNANGLEIKDFKNLKRSDPVRLGVTLSEKPQMMLNGRMVPNAGNRRNLSFGTWIGIGVGVVLIGGVLLVDSVIDRSKCCE